MRTNEPQTESRVGRDLDWHETDGGSIVVTPQDVGGTVTKWIKIDAAHVVEEELWP